MTGMRARAPDGSECDGRPAGGGPFGFRAGGRCCRDRAGPPGQPVGVARQDTPNPLVPTASIASVSCPSATTCTAVGQYFDPAGYWATLAEARNGTTWAVAPTSNPPAGATEVTLSGVSCTAADACTAAGFYVNSGTDTVTLAEAWNGATWNVQPTPESQAPSAACCPGFRARPAAAARQPGTPSTARRTTGRSPTPGAERRATR